MKKNIYQLAEIRVSYTPKIKAADRVQITSSAEAQKVFREIWQYPLELKECFYVLFLNRSNKVLGFHLLSIGGVSGTVVDVKSLFQTALKVNSSSLILAHNHPSGNPNASEADLHITNKTKEAAKLLDMQILDHLIILSEGYFSFADEGIL